MKCWGCLGGIYNVMVTENQQFFLVSLLLVLIQNGQGVLIVPLSSLGHSPSSQFYPFSPLPCQLIQYRIKETCVVCSQYKHAVYVQTCKLFADLERLRQKSEAQDMHERLDIFASQVFSRTLKKRCILCTLSSNIVQGLSSQSSKVFAMQPV